jgi:farnesyl-diphosphate farnesyltransferase
MLGAMMASALHPSEIGCMLQLKFGGSVRRARKGKLEDLADTLDDYEFCYEVLRRVSRSFAVVIQQLPDNLKDAVCIFYLVLRGLDSVEDDMTFDVKQKIPLLRAFESKLHIDGWNIEGVGDSHDYRVLMKHFHKVIKVYRGLDKGYQEAISDATQKMGDGMADFADKEGSIQKTEDYNLYCHYVAGLVGYGLSDLFSASGLEAKEIAEKRELSNTMGLFLQKTNIIRDYLEDLEDGRTWWPEEIWGKYSKNLSDFRDNPTDPKSLALLNHLVLDALQHAPGCLDYMRLIKTRKIFQFCAIPQAMAIATLEKVYNNPDVFRGNVKVRKGLSCKMMLQCDNIAELEHYFNMFAQKMRKRVPASDPLAKETLALLDEVQKLAPAKSPLGYSTLAALDVVAVLFVLFVAFCAVFCCGDAEGAGAFCGDWKLWVGLPVALLYLAGYLGPNGF